MNLLQATGDWFYPPDAVCAVCGKEAVLLPTGVCEACSDALVLHPACSCPAPLDGLVAGLGYTEEIEAAMHALKYHHQTWYAPFFAQFLEIPGDWATDCMIPMPLHWIRQWKRTYNQSELIARVLSRKTGLPVRTDLLRRIRYTVSQTTLSAAERRTNLIGAFAASKRVAGKSVLLVDDVTTTHASLVCCAEELKHAGATRVYAACACLTLPKGDSGPRFPGTV